MQAALEWRETAQQQICRIDEEVIPTRIHTCYYQLELASLKRLKTLLQTRAKHYQEQGFRLRTHPLTLLLLEGVADNESLSTPQQQILEAHPLNHTPNRLKEAS